MKHALDIPRHHRRAHRLSVAPAFEAGAIELGLDRPDGFGRLEEKARRVTGGRGPHLLVEEGPWPEPVRIRPAHRGGWLGQLLGDRLLSGRRPHAELAIWLELGRRGVRLPAPVFALSRRVGLGWRSHFAAVDLPDALDGAALLAAHPGPTRLREAARALARSLRSFHDAGALHGDLQVRNLLFEATERGLQCRLIDLDRTRLVASPSARQRMRELMRLYRSLEKLGHREITEPRLLARFLSDYCQGDRSLRRALWKSLGRERRRLARHRLAWRLEGLSARALLVSAVLLGIACLEGESAPSVARREAPPRLSLLAVGDTGRSDPLPAIFGGQFAVAEGLAAEARRQPVDTLVLLGDLFYWRGLDREHLVERIRENLVRPYCVFLRLDGPRSDEVESACRVAARDRSPVPIHAVLGNHDIELPESIALHRKAIPDFLPGWRMSSALAEVVELGEGVSLILFESEIAIQDREAIERALLDALTRARGPWRILATHRPIATDDAGNPQLGGYPAFVHDALAESERPVQLVLAGHHHSLQVFELTQPSPLLHIGAGSGSRAEPPLARDHPDVRFGSLELGFARVDLIGEGEAERLAVSLFATARWPWLATWRGPRLRARFEVDRHGAVFPIVVPGSEPARPGDAPPHSAQTPTPL